MSNRSRHLRRGHWQTILSLLIIVGITPVQAEEPDSERLVRWLSGAFTNYQQTLQQPEKPLTPLYFHIEPLDTEALDGHVLLSEQAHLFEPDRVLRRQIFHVERTRRGWQQSVYNVDPSLAKADLTKPDLWQPLHGCDIRWQWRGEQFVGERDSQRCYFYQQTSGEKIGLYSQLHLNPNRLSIAEQAFWADGTPILPDAESSPTGTHEYRRMEFYNATVQYRAPGTDTWRDAELLGELHDQGVRVGLHLPDQQQELRYQLSLRQQGQLVEFALFDMNGMETVHTQHVARGEGLAYESDYLRIEITVQPPRG